MPVPDRGPAATRILLAASFFLLLLVPSLLLFACGKESSERKPEAVGFDPDASAGASGFEKTGISQPALGPTFRTPSGRILVPGTRDEHGYVLPLDVARPGPEMAVPAPLDRDETLRRRGGAPPPPFEEHRLSADDGHTQNETTIAADGDVLVAGWNAFTDQRLEMGVSRSTDGGHTWTSGILGGHNQNSDPAVRSGGGGKWYYAYLATGGFGGSDYDIFVRRSTDDGATWMDPVDASQNGSFDDKPYIDARGHEVLVGWADFGFSPAKIRASRSLDGGATFGSIRVLSVHSVSGNGACPVIAPDGDYFMFWRDSAQESLWVARSTDQGANWSSDRGIVGMHPLPTPQPGGYRMVNLPSADADPLTGDLLVVWNDERFGDGDILAIRSTDSGASWSAPVRVNDDAGTGTQFFPWVSFDENGIAHVVWYDRREDDYDIDVYYARSLDGGQTFEANVRVTAAPFPPVLPWDAIAFIGDYNGIAATGAQVYPFYQDAREGNQDVYVSLLPGSASDVAQGRTDGAGLPGLRLSAAPMPFRTSTRLQLADAGAGDLQVEIHSLGGRILRRLELPAAGFAEWDGRDALGRELPAGVYYAGIRGESAPGIRLVKVP